VTIRDRLRPLAYPATLAAVVVVVSISGLGAISTQPHAVTAQAVPINPPPVGPQGPQGPPGADGAPATMSIGTVTTGAPGSPVTVTNSGTPTNAVFNMSIPQGSVGATGAVGATGTIGATGPAGAVGATGAVGPSGPGCSNASTNLQCASLTTNAAGQVTGTYPLAYPAGKLPIISALPVGVAGSLTNVQMVSETNTAATFQVNLANFATVSLIGLTILSIPTNPGVTTINVTALAPP
jgi:hypothetical protein